MTNTTLVPASKKDVRSNLANAHGIDFENQVATAYEWLLSSSPTAAFDGYKGVQTKCPFTDRTATATYHMSCKYYNVDAYEIHLQSLSHMEEHKAQDFIFYIAFWDGDSDNKKMVDVRGYFIPKEVFASWFRNIGRVVAKIKRERHQMNEMKREATKLFDAGNEAKALHLLTKIEWMKDCHKEMQDRLNSKKQPIKISLKDGAKCKMKTKVLLERLEKDCYKVDVSKIALN